MARLRKSKYLIGAPCLSKEVRKQLDGDYTGKVDDQRLREELKVVCAEIRRRREKYDNAHFKGLMWTA